MSYHAEDPVDLLRWHLPSVRDYFIGQALAGILANQHSYPTISKVEGVAELAIKIADAAIRHKKDKGD